MSRAERLLSLMESLRARRRPVSGRDLAQDLGISIRSLYRDIASLRALGADIAGEGGVGYVLRSGFVLPPVMFTAAEVDALVLGSLWVSDKADRPMAAAARAAMAKLTDVMPVALSDRVDAKYLSVTPAAPAPFETVDVAAIRRAIHNERKLRIGYRDAAGTASDRVIWPFFISYLDASRLISAWCELRGGIRHFRCDRMATLAELPARYPRRRHDLIADWRALPSAAYPPD